MTLDDVILALEMTNDASEAFYDLVTHEITWLDDFGMTREEYEKASDTLDEHGFKRLPSRRDIDEYGMMADFADRHHPSELHSAISGRGAFRRFKDAVRRMGLEQEWYQFRNAEYKRVAQEWCEDCGIILSGSGDDRR